MYTLHVDAFTTKRIISQYFAFLCDYIRSHFSNFVRAHHRSIEAKAIALKSYAHLLVTAVYFT